MMIDLALSGCGALGPAHVGAVAALRVGGMRIESIAGTSAGSIVAAGVACGFDTAAMRAIAEATIGTDLLDLRPLPFMRAGWGLCAGDALRRALREHLGDRRMRDVTIPLSVVATAVEDGAGVFFSSVATPDLRMVDVVLASCSIPFVFQAATIPGRAGRFVDGGLVANVPFGAMRSHPERVRRRVAVLVRGRRTARTVTGLLSYARAIMSAALDASHVPPDVDAIRVDVDGDALDLDIGQETIAAYHDAGYRAAERWLLA